MSPVKAGDPATFKVESNGSSMALDATGTVPAVNTGTYFNGRCRKSEQQVRTLEKLFREHKGKVTKELRKQAVLLTGLTWLQIYKWRFD